MELDTLGNILDQAFDVQASSSDCENSTSALFASNPSSYVSQKLSILTFNLQKFYKLRLIFQRSYSPPYYTLSAMSEQQPSFSVGRFRAWEPLDRREDHPEVIDLSSDDYLGNNIVNLGRKRHHCIVRIF